MAMQSDEITRLIKAAFPDALVEITDMAGDGDHYAASVVTKAFAGKSRVARHRLVYQLLQAELDGGVHALSLETLLPSEAAR